MTVATYSDVAARIGRNLTTFERGRVEAYLQDAEVEIGRTAPDRLTDPLWRNAVVSVECSVVIRAARLMDSLTQVVPEIEGAGFASTPATQGAVYLRRSERRTLGLKNTAAVQGAPDPVIPPTTDTPWLWAWEDDGGWD